MITTRERITPGELIRGAFATRNTDLEALLEPFLPLQDHHLVFTSQGKAAFEQIVLAAGLQGSRILLPAFFPEDFVGIFQKYGITPVFTDIDSRTYHLDLSSVTESQLEGTRGLVLHHTFGLPAGGQEYRAFADAHGLVMIEDCARGLGASRDGRLVGSFGHYAMFSLPKVLPVPAGGMSISERPYTPRLLPPKTGFFGVLHALTLVKYPFSAPIEGALYSVIADSRLYPREVGNYDPLLARELDRLARVMAKAFLPHYGEAISKKRACAAALRAALEPEGFTFQADDHGEHICTSVAVDPPPQCDPDALSAFLKENDVNVSGMWRDAIGISPFGQRTWGASPDRTPVSRRLAGRLIQLPVSRFHTPAQTRRIAELCSQFVRSSGGSRGGRLTRIHES